MWAFEEYTVYQDDHGVLRFEDLKGDLLGYITGVQENNINDLENGANPILDNWEDGLGNTISLEGWNLD